MSSNVTSTRRVREIATRFWCQIGKTYLIAPGIFPMPMPRHCHEIGYAWCTCRNKMNFYDLLCVCWFVDICIIDLKTLYRLFSFFGSKCNKLLAWAKPRRRFWVPWLRPQRHNEVGVDSLTGPLKTPFGSTQMNGRFVCFPSRRFSLLGECIPNIS